MLFINNGKFYNGKFYFRFCLLGFFLHMIPCLAQEGQENLLNQDPESPIESLVIQVAPEIVEAVIGESPQDQRQNQGQQDHDHFIIDMLALNGVQNDTNENGEASSNPSIPRVGWLNSVTEFMGKSYVKAPIDLLYDSGTVLGIILWGQTNKTLSTAGVWVCVGTHLVFAALPRVITNINHLVNGPSCEAPQDPSPSSPLQNAVLGTVKKVLEGMKIISEDGKIHEMKICDKKEI